jgi:PadR family transcriptional regulator PadR
MSRRLAVERDPRRERSEPSRVRGARRRQFRFTEPGVLLLLRNGPAHGYELVKRLPAVFPGVKARADQGIVYRVLRSLEAEGAVRSHWDHSDAGPARRVYELTPLGAEKLDGWRRDLAGEMTAIHGFLEEYVAGSS